MHDDDACVLTTELVKVLYCCYSEKGLILPFIWQIVVEKNLTNKIKNNHTDSLITILVSPAVHNFVLCSLLVAIPLLFLIGKPFFLYHVSPVSVSLSGKHRCIDHFFLFVMQKIALDQCHVLLHVAATHSSRFDLWVFFLLPHAPQPMFHFFLDKGTNSRHLPAHVSISYCFLSIIIVRSG